TRLFQHVDELIAEQFSNPRPLLDAFVFDALLHGIEHHAGGLQAGISADEGLLKFVPEVVVEVRTFEQSTDAAEEAAPGAFHGAFSLLVDLGYLFGFERSLFGFRESNIRLLIGCGLFAPEPHAGTPYMWRSYGRRG